MGEVWTRTHQIEQGRANLYIGRCTGQAFPVEQIRQIEESLAAKGLSLVETLRKIRNYEKALVVGQYVKLPEKSLEELEAIAAEPGMEMLQLVHSIFEDWVMTLFRGGKCIAATIFAEAVEKFIVDLGDGSNGKTLLQRIAEVSFGDYAELTSQVARPSDTIDTIAPTTH